MKLIPWFLIVLGGVMVYSGMKSQNPIAVLKGVLDGTGVPDAGQVAANTSAGASVGTGITLGATSTGSKVGSGLNGAFIN